MRILFVPTVLALALTGCGGGGSTEPTPSTPPESIAAPADRPSDDAVLQSMAGLDIGDVEQAIHTEATVLEADLPENAKIRELRNPKNQLSMVTLDLWPPYPKELWVTYTVRSMDNFTLTPVVLRGQPKIDDVPFDFFQTVMGAKANHSVPPEGQPREWRFDALFGLDPLPETMLINADVEMLMTPTGTDEFAIDPATVEIDLEYFTTELSNPLRVNFLPEAP